MTLDLTIVVPAFNEAHRLAEGMRRFEAAMGEGAVDPDRTEVIVIDDGSTDGTAEAARELLARLPHHRVVALPSNQGKGAAVRTGVSLATGRCTAYMDADMAIDPRAIPLLVEGLRVHDVAIGSRALPDSMVESTYVLRSLMGGLFNHLVTTGTGLGLHDTQCGFKAFRTPAARLLFHLVRIDRFAFDVEVLARARQLGLTITEVPVQWKHVPGSTVHPLHDSIAMLADVYRSRLGLRPTPPVPALAMRSAKGAVGLEDLVGQVGAAVSHALPDVPLPVLVDHDAVLVLLPLVPSVDRAALATCLEAALPGSTVGQQSMAIRSLKGLGPLGGRLGRPDQP